VTAVYRKYESMFDDVELNAQELFNDPHFRIVEAVEESKAINQIKGGAIIMSASGMCDAGRIKHHLANNLPRANATVLFVGYQAAGTLGRTILEGARRVRISGEDVAVRLRVREIGSYSAHADRHELIDWVQKRGPVAGSIFITHGEEPALESLAVALRTPANSVIVPGMEDSYALSHNRTARRIRAGRTSLREGLNRDWQNDYADFAVNLKQDLARIGDERRRREAIARMRAVLQSYRTTRAELRSRHAGKPSD